MDFDLAGYIRSRLFLHAPQHNARYETNANVSERDSATACINAKPRYYLVVMKKFRRRVHKCKTTLTDTKKSAVECINTKPRY